MAIFSPRLASRGRTESTPVSTLRLDGISTPSDWSERSLSAKYLVSNFPSLFDTIGLTTTRRRNKTSDSIKTESERREKAREDEPQYGSFGEEIRKRNEFHWVRIETVARETMEKYDVYVREIHAKNKRQREEIQRRAAEQQENMRRKEEKKRKERLKNSTYGRQWAHHNFYRSLHNPKPEVVTEDVEEIHERCRGGGLLITACIDGQYRKMCGLSKLLELQNLCFDLVGWKV
ncbi:hypothetical protein ScPMuIL_016249 [Solemya velum]